MSYPGSERKPAERQGLPLLPALLVGIGLLVAISVGSVMLIQWHTGQAIIEEFFKRVVSRSFFASEQALRRSLGAAVDMGNFISEEVRSGRRLISDPAFVDFLVGSLAAAPQIRVIIVTDRDGSALEVTRDEAGGAYTVERFDIFDEEELRNAVEEARSKPAPYWGEPVYGEWTNSTYLNYRIPIRDGETDLGFMAALISTEALSQVATQLSQPPQRLSFMLYGSDRVLAHPLMMAGGLALSDVQPLPELDGFGDLAMEALAGESEVRSSGSVPSDAQVSEASINGQRYLIFTTEVTGYGELPITLGYYVLESAVDAPLRWFRWATLVALAISVFALVAAGLLARTISRPVRRAAKGAAQISSLDFDEVAPLPHSLFRETNDLARAFNSMLEGLRAFGRYVPRTLVSKLIQDGGVERATEERELAVMFTDIVGFTAACEDKSAADVAAFINRHLTLVSACIEEERGTIDKYIGDAVMAFWGAPDRLDNPAEHACRAALAISQTLRQDTARRAGKGLRPVRLRIGLHLGSVVVGDIGAPTRINYTIVGDTVNAAQRLEALGKDVDPEAEVIILISQEVEHALPDGFTIAERGSHMVKGKLNAMEVFELVDRDSVSAVQRSDAPIDRR